MVSQVEDSIPDILFLRQPLRRPVNGRWILIMELRQPRVGEHEMVAIDQRLVAVIIVQFYLPTDSSCKTPVARLHDEVFCKACKYQCHVQNPKCRGSRLSLRSSRH